MLQKPLAHHCRELAGWERKLNKSELCALFHKVSGSANMKRKMGAAADRAAEEEDADPAGRKKINACATVKIIFVTISLRRR